MIHKEPTRTALRGATAILIRIIAFCCYPAVALEGSGYAPILWDSQKMSDEPLFFVKASDEENPCADLLFAPTSPITVRDVARTTLFEKGKDYTFHLGDRRVCLSPTTRIPFKRRAELYPKRKSPNSIEKHKFSPRNLLFSTNEQFGQFQVHVTYEHKGNDALIPRPPTTKGSLPRTLALLKNKTAFRGAVLGDSISLGLGASSAGFVDLFTAELQRRFKSPVSFANHSFSGATSKHILAMSEQAKATPPQLAIIAFGANDSGSAAEYGASIKMAMVTLKAGNPNIEFVLVSPLLINPEWIYANEPLQAQYRTELQKLEEPGVLFVDVGSVWLKVVEQKKFLDMTSNGVNHPNDFGHRLYAEVLLATVLGSKPAK